MIATVSEKGIAPKGQSFVFFGPLPHTWQTHELLCRYMANVMANSILTSTEDGSDFKILIGVADATTFGDSEPSWDTPASYQEICYVGDMDVRSSK